MKKKRRKRYSMRKKKVFRLLLSMTMILGLTVPSVTYASDIKSDQLPQSVCTEDAQLDEKSSTNSDEQKEQQQ